MDVMTQSLPTQTCGQQDTIQRLPADPGCAETTPRAEWNELISRSRKLANAAAMMVLTAALLAVTVGVLFCSVFTTVFRVFRGVIDRTLTSIEVPELLRPGFSDRAGYVDLTRSRTFQDDPMTAVREGIQRPRIGRHPSASLLSR
jgi:hypothetical protein